MFGDTTPPPTAPACATTFTWWTWPAAMAALDWMAGAWTGADRRGLRPASRRKTERAWRGHLQPGHGEGLVGTRRDASVRSRDSLPHHGPAPRRHRGVHADATKARDELG